MGDLDKRKEMYLQIAKNKADKEYAAYLAKYPIVERETFDVRKDEAVNYKADNTIATPFIDASLGESFTQEERIKEIEAVYKKALYISYLSGLARDLRDKIKACAIEELEDLKI